MDVNLDIIALVASGCAFIGNAAWGVFRGSLMRNIQALDSSNKSVWEELSKMRDRDQLMLNLINEHNVRISLVEHGIRRRDNE